MSLIADAEQVCQTELAGGRGAANWHSDKQDNGHKN